MDDDDYFLYNLIVKIAGGGGGFEHWIFPLEMSGGAGWATRLLIEDEDDKIRRKKNHFMKSDL